MDEFICVGEIKVCGDIAGAVSGINVEKVAGGDSAYCPAKYGRTRSPRYIHLEAGHAAQNTLLQAVSLGLGAVPIGAFEDIRVQEVLGLPADHEPLYLIPIGHPK